MRQRRQPRLRGRQDGQSLTEAAVLCAVLVPLFLLIPIMGKYIHLRQATQQAARAAAWEATVAKDYALPATTRMRDLTVDRHFGKADAQIVSRASTGNSRDRVENPLLNTFSNQTLVERGDIRVDAYKNERSSGILDRIGGLLSKIPGNFPPNDKGLVTSNLSVSVQDLKLANGGAASFLEPFDQLGLRMQASNTLLADPWNAAGPGSGNNPAKRSVVGQVRTLVPTSHLSDAAKMFDGLSIIPIVGTISRFDPGYIAPDVVPVDKLEPYAKAR